MQIILYSGFKKRENSTKTPDTTTTKRTLTGYMIEPCSIMHPVFKIERFSSDASPQSFTYAYIGEFARHYFVTDWVWKNGLWECHLDVDVLASFKTAIGNTTAYVERCASTFNGAIVDKMYPATTDFDIEKVSLTASWHSVTPDSGCYVLGIIGTGNSLIGGATSYYVFTKSELNTLLEKLMSDDFLGAIGFSDVQTAIQQLSQQTAKAIINPLQYITSCIWLPVSKSAITGSTSTDLFFGYWNLNVCFPSLPSGKLLNANAFTMSVSGSIPIHPQAPTRGKYLNYAPYTRITVSIPPFGSFPIDTSYCEIGSYLKGTVYVDTVTGKATLQLKIYESAQELTNGIIVYETSGMMGIPIQISQTGTNYLHTAESIVGAVSSLASDNYAGVATSIGNSIESMMPSVITKGADGSFLAEIVQAEMTVHHYVIADDNNTEFGKPLCETKTINTMSGFIKCLDADVDFACYESEKSKIKTYMTSGFFWE